MKLYQVLNEDGCDIIGEAVGIATAKEMVSRNKGYSYQEISAALEEDINKMLKMSKKTYSLWRLKHISVYVVMAVKVRDTNSSAEVERWVNKDYYNAASFYREEDELNANYLQLFEDI